MAADYRQFRDIIAARIGTMPRAPSYGWVFVEDPVTTCTQCQRMLKGATPYLCVDCLAPIKAAKHRARKERKRLKRASGAASQAFAGGIT